MSNSSKSSFFSSKKSPPTPTGKGVTRQIIGYDESIMMVKVIFEQGASGTPHAHEAAQTTYVESGLFEFTVEGETRQLEPGDGVYIEPNAMHNCICLKKGALIDVFSPARMDFLEEN